MSILMRERHPLAVDQCSALSPSLKTIIKSKVGLLTCSSLAITGQLGTVAAIENLYRIPLHAQHVSRTFGQAEGRFGNSNVMPSPQMLHACPPQQNIKTPHGKFLLAS